MKIKYVVIIIRPIETGEAQFVDNRMLYLDFLQNITNVILIHAMYTKTVAADFKSINMSQHT